MSEVKDYVSVNEGEFGKKESLKLTVNGRILENNLKGIVESKVSDLNKKLDAAYNVSGLNFDKGNFNISEAEKQVLVRRLNEVVKGFNQEIARIQQEYIGRTSENKGQIQSEISTFFSDKTIFVEKGGGLASAIRGYSSIDREAAAPQREKEVSLK